MGVLNVTPDSFSDGGHFVDVAAAVAHGMRLRADGADIVDVGGESTRPGAERVPVEIELRRVVPVVRELAAAGVAVSIDTTRREVAEAAVGHGAIMVNDVSGATADPAMAGFVADAAVDFVAMHWRGHSRRMQQNAVYHDVLGEVVAALARRASDLTDAGVDPRRIILDPGLGFAKLPEHNWALLAGMGDLTALGHPVLIGASRKSFLGALAVEHGLHAASPADRDGLSAAVAVLAATSGAAYLRVHDVKRTREAIVVARKWVDAAVHPAVECHSTPAGPRARTGPGRHDDREG